MYILEKVIKNLEIGIVWSWFIIIAIPQNPQKEKWK